LYIAGFTLLGDRPFHARTALELLDTTTIRLEEVFSFSSSEEERAGRGGRYY
jgi:hypothetical protein